jgi:dynamin GTPase
LTPCCGFINLVTIFTFSSQSNAKIEELLQEDHNAKRRREKAQKQSSLLSTLTRQLSIHDNRAAVASYSDDTSGPGKLTISNIYFMLQI